MKRAGWNYTRRNRNIGISKQGYGKDNVLSIPQPADTLQDFYERFDEAEIHTISIRNTEIPVAVEQVKKGYFYSCTPADVQRILHQLPEHDLEGFGMIIFRQPKKKEVILSSVWGRLIYSLEFRHDYCPAIILEATPTITHYSYPKKQSVEEQREFELLQQDGLHFVSSKRVYIADIDEEKVRSIQLYRTLLHEVGHYVHYLEVVERPGSEEENFEEWEKRSDRYFSIPVQEKEVYANRYAIESKMKLLDKGVIPFDKMT